MTGRLIEIYWDGDDTWFEAEVLSFDKATGLHAVVYLEDEYKCDEMLLPGGAGLRSGASPAT